MTGMPRLSHPVFGLATVTTKRDEPWRIVVEYKPSIIGRFMARFIQDCRDLWALITKGQPKDDPLLPWRMMAELAKSPAIDIDAWEADMFARSGVWWFDPARYDGTPFAWPKRVEPISQQGYWGLMQAAPADYKSQRQAALIQQIAAQSQLQAHQAMMQSNPWAQAQANSWHAGYDLLNPEYLFRIKNG